VIDALDPVRLLPEVLLYDKLVLPVPKTVDDRLRWIEEGWHPESQERYYKTLGDLAVFAWWSKEQEVEWAEEYKKLQQDMKDVEDESTKKDLPYAATRRVLAMKRYAVPGGDEIESVAAFQSESRFEGFFQPDAKARATHGMGYKLRQRIAVPQPGKFPHGTLATVVALSGEREFLEKRTQIYQKEDEILSDPDPSAEDLQKLEQLSDELAKYVDQMLSGVSYTSVVTVAALPPGCAVGRWFPAHAAKSSNLSLIHLKANLAVLDSRAGSPPTKAVYHY
jgi:hypothetical protein